jgi:hypothetical protein
LKRTVIDTIRRGFENTLANWPVILLRLGEVVVLTVLVLVTVIAAVVPIAVSAGLSRLDLERPEDVAQVFATLFIEHWILIVYLLLLFFAVFGVLIAVHSFVEAGSAQVFIDGERVPGFRAFAFHRWMLGGRKGWWTVFWIYNVAWSVGLLLPLALLLATITGMLVVDQTTGRVAIGCIGFAFAVLLLIPIAILVGMWTQKAIAICVSRSLGALDALRAARREIRLDLGRHLGVFLLLMVISIVVAGFISGVSFPLSLGSHGHNTFLPLFFAPMQIALSIFQNAVSAAIGAWFLASFVALTEER